MLSYLKSLAVRIGWHNFGGLPDQPSEDPFAEVREPRRRGPGGKSTAVGVAEPEERPVVWADARHESRMMTDRSASGD